MMLRFVLLAGLGLEPRSGYDLGRWFARVARHYWSRAAGHGSIYPMLAALEREGLVMHTVVPSGRGPVRKVFSLTASGRAALLEWLDLPADEVEVRDEQLIKALCFGLLPPERAVALLQAARGRYVEQVGHYEELARRLDTDPVAGDGSAPAVRLGRLLTLRYSTLMAASCVAWCDEAAALVEAQADELHRSRISTAD